MKIQSHVLSLTSLIVTSTLLVSCGKQAPVAVVDGYSGRVQSIGSASSEEVAYGLQSEAILSSQKEQEYYVQFGDKVEQLAKHFDVSEESILERNGLKEGDKLPVGQYIVIPNADWKSMASASSAYRLTDKYRDDAESSESETAEAEETSDEAFEKAANNIVLTETVIKPEKTINLMREHVLQPGENIYRISLKYRVSQFDILAANNISRPDDLKPGMVIKIPPAGEKVNGREAFEYLAAEKTTTAEVPTKAEVAKIKESAEKVVIPQKPKMQTNAELAKQAPETTKRVIETKEDLYAALAEKHGSKRVTSKGMIWPAEGKVLQTFGQKGRGINHSGIKIGLPLNAPIYAAESGTVLYSGDGLEIYGNLILIKHDGGLVTAYAHNAKNLVKRYQKVAKGDLIGFAGNTGNVERPQLHFEVRRNTQPVDPQKYLPK